MPRLERLALALLLLAAACSKKPAQNYRNCLKLRIGMTSGQLMQMMGEPDESFPYVEGKSLPHLKGRTAYEWSNPGSMPSPNRVSLDDATGKVESIRCGDAMVTTAVVIEPPTGESAPAPASAPAEAAREGATAGLFLPATVVISVGEGQGARLMTAALGSGEFRFQSGWTESDGGRLIQIDGSASPVAKGPQELAYTLTYTITPPKGRAVSMKAEGRVKIPAEGEVLLGNTQDGPVKLTAAGTPR